MNHMRGLVSSAQALRQTFISTHISSSAIGFVQFLSPLHVVQKRYFQPSFRLAARPAPTARKMLTADEAIRAPYVQIVNDEGSLNEPERLHDILDSFDRSKFFLLQVSPGGPREPPVCKILNKMEYRASEKAKEKAAKASKVQLKQIELNWAIDAHDLSHRLKQLATFLEKGRKVEVILIKKKHKRSATVDEIKHVIQSVMDATREAGGTLVKPMEGEPGKQVTITAKKD
ncbi:hypothetical protein N7495_002613 [Penicillium taxi]|uniref:uncharacterized protein n=1 Tax=Penicillium taxi TaxID=168475 RepID=UPI00254575F1|nr:uncharacterized protein N7495_002613 [Penicillium taxi]KAJ5902085.1 hypothetical protein N7495_002613 [Penicillium taxi]